MRNVLVGLAVIASVVGGDWAVQGTAAAGHLGRRSDGGALRLAVFTWKGSPVSPKAIPLGDGKVATAPRRGYVESCTTHFGGQGPPGNGPWINTAKKTWSSLAKPHVQGAVSWPSALHSFSIKGTNRILTTNDLPSGETTGTFPIQTTDPAYQYDHNPNRITAQSVDVSIPASPTAAPAAECVDLGPIGVTTDGVEFFDALDALGRDAAAHEILDTCGGHPAPRGVYHYHSIGSCLTTGAKKNTAVLVGYALDGYGLYVERDAKGNLPTDADLDACHGRKSAVLWDGKKRDMYHYDVTLEYPYTVGCYHGIR
jgi:hypothetical protein